MNASRPVAAPVSDDGADYAQREAQDKEVADFEGGSAVIIGLSAGVLVVLLLLLLIV